MNMSVETAEKTVAEIIEARVVAFLGAMCNWEVSCHQDATMLLSLSKDKSISDEHYYKTKETVLAGHKAVYLELIAEYCTKQILDTKQIPPQYNNPPAYDPTTELVEEVKQLNKNNAEVIMQQQEGNEWKNKYVLVNQKGRWLIKEKQVWISHTNEWIISTI